MLDKIINEEFLNYSKNYGTENTSIIQENERFLKQLYRLKYNLDKVDTLGFVAFMEELSKKNSENS